MRGVVFDLTAGSLSQAKKALFARLRQAKNEAERNALKAQIRKVRQEQVLSPLLERFFFQHGLIDCCFEQDSSRGPKVNLKNVSLKERIEKLACDMSFNLPFARLINYQIQNEFKSSYFSLLSTGFESAFRYFSDFSGLGKQLLQQIFQSWESRERDVEKMRCPGTDMLHHLGGKGVKESQKDGENNESGCFSDFARVRWSERDAESDHAGVATESFRNQVMQMAECQKKTSSGSVNENKSTKLEPIIPPRFWNLFLFRFKKVLVGDAEESCEVSRVKSVQRRGNSLQMRIVSTKDPSPRTRCTQQPNNRCTCGSKWPIKNNGTANGCKGETLWEEQRTGWIWHMQQYSYFDEILSHGRGQIGKVCFLEILWRLGRA